MTHPTILTACNPGCGQNFWSKEADHKISAPGLVDTQDKKWQADPQFSPDKESSWSYPKEKDGWMLAHNAIRGEVAAMKLALAKVVERKCVQQWEIAALRAAWEEHFAHISAHHSNEEQEFNPFLVTRVRLPEKFERDHDDLIRQLNLLNGLFAGLSGSAVELNHAWLAYEEMLLPHLLEEEVGPLPLMRAYFRPEEIAPIVQKIVGKGPACEMGSFIYYAGEEASFEFMKQEGIPGFVWYIDFKGKRDQFQRSFAENLQAVVAGTPPQPASSFFGSCCQAQTRNDDVVVPEVHSVLGEKA
eukprot:TRINITY_DN1829_c0_g1_i3.p1 TRINITY_DN1829_c0_g1~~TRINITY_DN1829_c0_g1_i3.p1  ORF type:complete len:318 (-),score=54.86 TRINITY_DN1829_c0_g1_i3:234-1136(-)